MSSFESRSNMRRKAQLTEYACRMRKQSTLSEQMLWAAIRGRSLGVQFRRQVPIAGAFIADFMASEIKLVVEVDGTWHCGRAVADVRRDRKLQRLGYTVLRLPAHWVVQQLPVALQHVQAAIARLLGAVDEYIDSIESMYSKIAKRFWIWATAQRNEDSSAIGRRVGTPISEGPSQGTVLVLFTYGSSGRRVVTPVAGRFTTSTIPVPT